MPQQDFWSAAVPTPTPSPPVAPPPTQTDFWSTPAKTSEAPTTAPAQSTGFWQSPENGQSKPVSDPNQSVLGKAWDWANTPLINFNKENQGGFVGGTEDVASGLTSPLSIGLTLGTLGAGPLLRGLGLAAEELPVAIRGIKGLVDAGFTLQGAIGVAKESPRVLDALKEGDYETAKRLAVHVAAGGAMTYLGAKHASSDIGDLADTAAENLGFKVKPSQAVKQISGLWGVRNREVQEAQDTALSYAKQAKADFKAMTPEQRSGTMFLMQAENARELADRHNMLADAAGRSEDKVAGGTSKFTLGLAKQEAGAGTKYYNILKDGKPIGATAVWLKMSPDTAYLDWIGESVPKKDNLSSGYSEISNQIGRRGLLDLLRQFKEQNPEIEKIEGIRIGGRATDTLSPREMNISDILKNGANEKQSRYDELTAQQNVKGKYTPEEIDNLLKGYKEAIKAMQDRGAPEHEIKSEVEVSPDEKTGKPYGQVSITLHNAKGQQVGNALVGFEGDGIAHINDSGIEAGQDLANEKSDYRNKGLGTKMYVEAMNKAKEAGAETITSGWATSPDAARVWRSLIKRFGGAETKKANGDPFFSIDLTKIPKEALKQDLKGGSPVYGQMLKLASQSKDMFEDLFRKAKDGGLMKNAVEKYITQIWKKEDLDNPAANRLRDEAAGPGFAQNISQARKRTFDNAFEGQLLGRKLQTADPVTLVSKYISDLGEALANRNFKKNVLENVRASDGRPVAALSGSGHIATNEEGDSSVLVNPGSTHDIRIKDRTIDFMKQAGVFDQWRENGTIVKIPHESKEIYGWNTHDYRESPSSAMEDWHYAGHGPDGTPVLVKARYNIHPEAYEYLNRLVGAEPSAIRQMKPLNWLLKASSEAKHMMLSFSPFHIAQEGLRAAMTGISPFRSEKLNINENPTLGKIVEEGLTRGKEHLGLADYDDSLREGLGGRSKLLDLAGKAGEKLGIAGKPLTVLRDIQNYTTEFLFDKYLPALKDRAALELYDRWNNKLQDDAFFSRLQKDHPEFDGYTKDRAAAKLAAMETNERFGGLNYKQMGRSVGTQDFLRLATLAPDWLESELRSIKRIFDPTGGTMLRRDVVRMAAAMWATSRALNMLISGKPHNEAPFGVAWTDKDGKEKIYSIRTLPTDMFHATTDPVGFMRGRMSPLVRSTAEAYSGRDFQGRKLTPGDTAVDIVRNNFVPIPAQAVLKGATGGSPDLTTPDQAIKAAGLTAQVYRSEAQKLANQLSSNKNETGPVDEAQLRKHRAVIDLENQIRSGQAPLSTLNDLVESGHLSQKDAKVVHKNVQETHGLDPEMAQLYSQASRLPTPDFLKIWDSATPNEQSVLAKLLIKKRTAYNQKVLKEMTPAQRTADPTYQRLKQMFPGQMVF